MQRSIDFTELLDFTDKHAREELGDYYIIPKIRMDNITSNMDKQKKTIAELREIIKKRQAEDASACTCHSRASYLCGFLVDGKCTYIPDKI